MTDDEETSCQSSCEQPGSGGSGGDVQKRTIGYYKEWNDEMKCIGMPIRDIPVGSINHLYYSFAYMSLDDYEIFNMVRDKGESPPERTFADMTDLKKQYSNLKVVVALVGWSFYVNNTIWQPVFSDMVSTELKRAKSITNAMRFMTRSEFDGVDLD